MSATIHAFKQPVVRNGKTYLAEAFFRSPLQAIDFEEAMEAKGHKTESKYRVDGAFVFVVA